MPIQTSAYQFQPIDYNFDYANPGTQNFSAFPGGQPDTPQSSGYADFSAFPEGDPSIGSDTKGPRGYTDFITGLDALGGLSQAYLGFENLKLGKKQFGLAKSSFEKNLANQALTTNTALEAQARARLSSTGQYDRPGGQTSLEQDLESYVAPRRVSGTLS